MFGKQNPTEVTDKSNSLTARSIPITGADKKPDDSSSNPEASSSTISRLYPVQPDNIPAHLVARYESTILSPVTTMNRIPTVVSFDYLEIHLFLFVFHRDQPMSKNPRNKYRLSLTTFLVPIALVFYTNYFNLLYT